MAAIAAGRTGPTTLLTAGTWRFGRGDDGRRVWWVGRGRLRLAAKKLAFAQAELGAQEFEFGLQFGDAGASALMHALPVTGLLAEFEIFDEQWAEVAAWPRRGRLRVIDRRG